MKTYTKQQIEKAVKKAGYVADNVLKHLDSSITERVQSFEDACEETGMSDELPFDSHTKDLIEKSVNAYYQLCVITKALNEDWEIDVKNENQVVWVNWFTLRGLLSGGDADYGALAGFGYSNADDAPSDADTAVGSRLCYCDKKTADFSRIHFNKIWLAYMVPEITLK